MLFLLALLTLSTGDGGQSLLIEVDMLDSWASIGRRAGERVALLVEGPREMRLVDEGIAGTAGWIEGKVIERSEAGVSSSITAVLLPGVVGCCWED